MPLISKRIAVLVAGGLPGGLEAGDRAAGEAGEEEHRVVDSHRPHAAADGRRTIGCDAAGRYAGWQFSLLDKRLRDRPADFRDLLAGDEAGHVDDVGVQVAVGAGAGQVLIEPPKQRHAVAGPVLQIRRPNVANLAQPAFLYESIRQPDCRARGDS